MKRMLSKADVEWIGGIPTNSITVIAKDGHMYDLNQEELRNLDFVIKNGASDDLLIEVRDSTYDNDQYILGLVKRLAKLNSSGRYPISETLHNFEIAFFEKQLMIEGVMTAKGTYKKDHRLYDLITEIIYSV